MQVLSFALSLEIQLSGGEVVKFIANNWISSNVTCRVIFFASFEFRLEVIVYFVNIGGIVDDCLNLLFIKV